MSKLTVVLELTNIEEETLSYNQESDLDQFKNRFDAVDKLFERMLVDIRKNTSNAYSSFLGHCFIYENKWHKLGNHGEPKKLIFKKKYQATLFNGSSFHYQLNRMSDMSIVHKSNNYPTLSTIDEQLEERGVDA